MVQKPPGLGLMFFAADGEEHPGDRYKVVLQTAQLADKLAFDAVWLPERHFHQFGGLFPNPSVLAASIAMTTSRLRLRAGSVVLPLHDPVRVAEEWAMVDNLSHGRVDLAFATGWDADSFILAPEQYASRIDETFSLAQVVRKLWRGHSIERLNGKGATIAVRIHPTPVQPDLRIWITATRKTALFKEAGRLGYNILTALLFQSMDELAANVLVYRNARKANGYDPAAGTVTVMLHTFAAETMSQARQIVHAPMLKYLESSVDLWSHELRSLAELTKQERDDVLELAFERYIRFSSLIGDPPHCTRMIESLGNAGRDEIACLIDFGMQLKEIECSMHLLSHLQVAGL